jgi:hypothetical protein
MYRDGLNGKHELQFSPSPGLRAFFDLILILHRDMRAETKASKDELQTIWKSFGRYITKTLTSGKGVGIPKFGNFTFTPI